jgi:uncharacterized protein (TIGR02118 family)
MTPCEQKPSDAAKGADVYTVTVLYPQPDDRAVFNAYHDDIHVPIARGMTGLVRWTAHRIEPGDGELPPYHMIVQLSAPDRATLEEVLNSSAGKAAAADVPNFATGGAIFLFGEQDVLLDQPASEDVTDTGEPTSRPSAAGPEKKEI